MPNIVLYGGGVLFDRPRVPLRLERPPVRDRAPDRRADERRDLRYPCPGKRVRFLGIARSEFGVVLELFLQGKEKQGGYVVRHKGQSHIQL